MEDPRSCAEEAGLRYVRCDAPGYSRRRAGRGFVYLDHDGGRIDDPAVIEWLRALAIPPAWTEVWICPKPDGHIQATGRDARGRKQYRYHPRWREIRDGIKYERTIDFARTLPRLRRRVRRDLRREHLDRRKVLASIVRILDETFLRIGNAAYAEDNGSFGLTTLQRRHARVEGDEVCFRFRSKGGKVVQVRIDHPRVARVVRRCAAIPGQELFCYPAPGGVIRAIGSGDVNDYLAEVAGGGFTAKDFRTWAGTVLTAGALVEIGPAPSERRAERNVLAAIDVAAARLGDTRAVTRGSYVHPEVLEAYRSGHLLEVAERQADGRRKRAAGLRSDEALVLAVLLDVRRAGQRQAA